MSPMKLKMQDLKQRFLSETRFNDQEEHCQVYKLLFTKANFVQSEYDSLGDKGVLRWAYSVQMESVILKPFNSPKQKSPGAVCSGAF